MTLDQLNNIWNLAIKLQTAAILFGGTSLGTEENYKRGIALIEAKSELYQYLQENLDDNRTSK